MKLVIFGIAAFVTGLAGGTTLVVMKAPPPKAEAHATGAAAADSTSAPAATPAPAVDSSKVVSAMDSSATRSTRGPREADSTRASRATAQPAITASSEAGRRVAAYKQIARILTTLKPAEARGIMAHLTDDQVEGILRVVGVRQAAALLSDLPTERAAAMSRRLLEHPSPEDK